MAKATELKDQEPAALDLRSGLYSGTVTSDRRSKMMVQVRLDFEESYVSADFFVKDHRDRDRYRASMRARRWRFSSRSTDISVGGEAASA